MRPTFAKKQRDKQDLICIVYFCPLHIVLEEFEFSVKYFFSAD